MNTSHQFLLLQNPPAKEKVFQDLKKKHGSEFAFQWVAMRIPLIIGFVRGCLRK